MGIRQKRIGDAEMEAFMDEFMEEMSRAFPKLMIQFEVSSHFEIYFHKKAN
jgi:malate dehydrogenase (oxaloacetate-decarboxylating)(NADP+)